MIKELKEVRDALAAYNTSSTVKHPLIREHGIRALATIDRIISDHIPDASKMVVPDGYALVPIEPTYEMVKAAWRYQYLHVGATAVEADLLSENRSNNKEQFEMDCNAYKAMLSAAPQPEQSDLLKDIHDAADVQAALNALFRLENDAISSRDGYGYSGGDAEIIRKIIMGYAELKENKAALTAQKQEWMPIDTAPHGVWILIFAYGVVCQACWNANGYWSAFDNNRIGLGAATHWMPLPEPPTTEETK